MKSAQRPRAIDDVFRPTWDGYRRTIACHKADLDGTHAPNSVAAVQACVAAGAPRVELDLRFLADGVMVAFHDAELQHDSTGRGNVEAADLGALEPLRYLGFPETPIARFAELVDAVRGSRTVLQVDLKALRPLDGAQLDALDAVLRPVADHCIVGTPAHWNLAPIAARGFRVAFDPTRHWHYWPGRPADRGYLPALEGLHGLWDDSPLAHVPGVEDRDYVASRMNDLMGIAPAAAEWMMDMHTLRHLLAMGFPMGHLLHERGIELAAWTVQDRGEATTTARVRELFDLGADTIIADRAVTIAGYLA